MMKLLIRKATFLRIPIKPMFVLDTLQYPIWKNVCILPQINLNSTSVRLGNIRLHLRRFLVMQHSDTLGSFDTIFNTTIPNNCIYLLRSNTSNINFIVCYVTYSHITSFVHIVNVQMTSALIDPILNATAVITILAALLIFVFLRVSAFSFMWLIIA